MGETEVNAIGVSASTDYCPGKLWIFSSNAPPFEPGMAYNKFAAYCLLAHEGDFNKAAIALKKERLRRLKIN